MIVFMKSWKLQNIEVDKNSLNRTIVTQTMNHQMTNGTSSK